MQIYRILYAVCVLAISSRATRNGGCYVPRTLNGDLKEEVPGFHRMNWTTFNFDRTLSDENVQVGSVRPRRAELFLLCHDGYSVQGTKGSMAVVRCLNGRWSPDPVCLRSGTKYSPNTAQPPFIPDSPASEDECSCEYTLDDKRIVAYTDGKLVRLHERVKNGSIVKFRCSKIGYHQFLGPQEIQCENCQSWNASDFPTCVRPESGDAMIFLDNSVNMSVEGILRVEKGKHLRLVCSGMETAEFPTWNVPNVAGINLTEEVWKTKKDVHLYLSHLDIEKSIPEDGGSYACALEKEGRPAVVQVQVVVKVPIMDSDTVLRIPSRVPRTRRNEGICKRPVTPEHGFLKLMGELKAETLALYSCEGGWKMVGASASKCLSTGKWTSPPPKCIAVKSTPPEPTATAVSQFANATPNSPTTPKQTQQENCSCTYNSNDRTLSAAVDGFGLLYGDKVNKGYKITLICYKHGYHLVLPNDTSISGSLTLSCDVCQTWEDSDLPSCKAVSSEPSCERPLSPEHGSMRLRGKPKVNSRVLYSCDEGWKLVGASTSKCLSTGQWTFSPPTCLERSCERPLSPEHGFLRLLGEPKVGSTVTYVCDEGLTLVGAATSKCLPTEQWSFPPPKCLEPSCERPLSPEHGSMLLRGKPKVNSRVLYSCDEGWKLVGASTSKCLSTGQWTFPPPTCLEPSCEMPLSPEHGSLRLLGKPNVDSVVVYMCNEGRTLVGAATSKCLSTEQWNFPPPKCLSSCVLSAVSNGSIGHMDKRRIGSRPGVRFVAFQEGKVFKHNETAILHCKDGFEPVGISESFEGRNRSEKVVTCEDGQWSQPLECISDLCALSAVSNGTVGYMNRTGHVYLRRFVEFPVGKIFGHKDTVILRCEESFVPSGSSQSLGGPKLSQVTVTCRNGQWSQPLECISESCLGEPPAVENGYPVVRNRAHGSRLYYRCKKYYWRSSIYHVECNYGKWTGQTPTCTDTRCYLSELTSPTFVKPMVAFTEHGKNVTLTCRRRIAASRKRINVSCKFGKFEIPEEACIEQDCTVPWISNGHIEKQILGTEIFNWWKLKWKLTITYQEVRTLSLQPRNTTLFLVCEHSQQGIGASRTSITCSGGRWSPNPVCHRNITCRTLKESDMLTISYTDNQRVDSLANFHCIAPGVLSGVTRTVCLENGEWKDPLPTCRKKEILCPRIDDTESFSVTFSDGLKIDSTTHFRCKDRNVEVGDSLNVRTCMPSGNWSGTNPKCEGVSGCRIDAQAVSPLLIIEPLKRYYSFGENIILSCPLGQELTNEVEMVMCLGSAWSENEFPKCRAQKRNS